MDNCEECSGKKLSSLQALNTDELKFLDGSKTLHRLKKGEAIFLEGEKINGIYCIKEGVCKKTKLSTNGSQQVVKLSGRGELLGQRSLISDEAVGLSAVAINDMCVCFIPKETVTAIFTRNNQFSIDVMKSICGDLKQANSHLVDMAQKSVRQRLAGTLLYLYDNFGRDEDGSLKVKLSREDLAGITGTAIESCIRLLSELKKAGIVTLKGKNIIVTDLLMLKKMTG